MRKLFQPGSVRLVTMFVFFVMLGFSLIRVSMNMNASSAVMTADPSALINDMLGQAVSHLQGETDYSTTGVTNQTVSSSENEASRPGVNGETNHSLSDARTVSSGENATSNNSNNNTVDDDETPADMIEVVGWKSHGFGVDLLAQARRLKDIGKRGKQEMKVIWGMPAERKWLYGKGVCPSEDMHCFFQKPPRMNHGGRSYPKTESEALKMLLVPLPNIQKEVEQMPGLYPSDLPPGEPYGVFHVRHADTALNFGYLNISSTPLIGSYRLKDYIQAYRMISNMPNKPKNVILLTDDQNVIDDLNQNYNQEEDIKFYYLQRKRFRGSEGGFENHFPSGSQRGELMTILKIKEVTANCSVWVGSTSSFAKVLLATMEKLPRQQILNTQVPMTNSTEASQIIHGMKPSGLLGTRGEVRFIPGGLKNLTSQQVLSLCRADAATFESLNLTQTIQTLRDQSSTATMESCKASLVKYCCLNVELPSTCIKQEYEENLYCMLRYAGGNRIGIYDNLNGIRLMGALH